MFIDLVGWSRNDVEECFKAQFCAYGLWIFFISVTVMKSTLFIVVYLVGFVLKPRIASEFIVYATFYL